MTKEELINSVLDVSSKSVLQDIFNEFLDSNVCIPKGENCHPYHMELHQWAENPLVDLPVFNVDHGIFYLSIFDEYHIKPSEPVYEWQWMEMQVDGTWQLTPYETTEESNAIGEGLGRTPEYRIEQTKRERT